MAARSSSNSPSQRPRAAYLGPELRRPLILDVAGQLFREHGYKGTSMDAIAHAAGVSKPVVYDCFASKGELFGALLDREEERMFDQFGAALMTGAQVGDLEVTLRAGFTSMLQAVAETPEAYRIVLMDAGDAHALIAARVRRGRDRQVAAIVKVARVWLDGRIPERRLDAAAAFVGNTLLAIGEAGVRMMISESERWTPETLGRALAQLAGRGYLSLVLERVRAQSS
jgi:AcrR family transcriptional regulator